MYKQMVNMAYITVSKADQKKIYFELQVIYSLHYTIYLSIYVISVLCPDTSL